MNRHLRDSCCEADETREILNTSLGEARVAAASAPQRQAIIEIVPKPMPSSIEAEARRRRKPAVAVPSPDSSVLLGARHVAA